MRVIPGLDPPEFPYPRDFEDCWDNDHVRLPCSSASSSSSNKWLEIVQGLTAPIKNSRQLSETISRWIGGDDYDWNTKGLEAFLNQKADKPVSSSTPHARERGYNSPLAVLGDAKVNPEEQDMNIDGEIPTEDVLGYSNRSERDNADAGDTMIAEEDFFNKEERDRFFTIILPKIQALALRLPELVKKPIPLLKQQEDSAVTLSQEQIACLLAHAFFNTFPCRNMPPRRHSNADTKRRRAFEPSEPQKRKGGDDSMKKRKDGEGRTLNDAPKDPHGTLSKTKGQPSGNSLRNADRQMSLFAYFGKKDPVLASSSASAVACFRGEIPKARTTTTTDADKIRDTKKDRSKDEQPRYPSINFWTLFRADGRYATCTPTNAAKLRCILHYFDRVTTRMPQGVVTYHRQVLQSPITLEQNERVSSGQFCYVHIRVENDSPLEDDAPQGALQLDFANKVIGGGILGHGAVQEEIRFAICPELILSRLFIQSLEDNEAVLIKGAERYSNYNGYASTFTWHSDFVDDTPRDGLGRRKTEICAIDALPFGSKDQRLRQFSECHILRELNKAIAGFRRSPIIASEWGLCRAEGPPDGIPPIAT
ncbi:hypothetical protein BGZ54_008133, partial [Gamsiella multidivaricata]